MIRNKRENRSLTGFTPLRDNEENQDSKSIFALDKKEAGQKRYKSLTGFTLIELLVVIAIIGLLASIITTAVSNTRIKARDARRLSDVKQIKSGMDIYYSSGNGYPPAALWVAGTRLACATTDALTIPRDPLNDAGHQYVYTELGGTISGCGRNDLRQRFTLQFVLEKTGATYTMTEDGQFSPALPAL